MWYLIGLYLTAATAADLIVAVVPANWRPAVVIVNSFVFIALDLTAGDRLHELWHGRGLVWRMGAVIAAGAGLAYVLNGAAGPVALASCTAFAASATTDRLVYAGLWRLGWRWHARVNGSNAISAAVDSAIFLCGIATAGLLPWSLVPWLVISQWLAKVLGGAVWSVLLRRRAAIAEQGVLL